MSKVEVSFIKYVGKTLELMQDPGLLLVSTSKNEKPNVMTIGWGTKQFSILSNI